MSYKLPTSEKNKKGTVRIAFYMFAPLVAGEKKSIIIALVSVLINSATNLI
jgi:hypothetical protein